MSPEDGALVYKLQLAVPQTAEDKRRLISAKRALRTELAAAKRAPRRAKAGS